MMSVGSSLKKLFTEGGTKASSVDAPVNKTGENRFESGRLYCGLGDIAKRHSTMLGCRDL